MGSEYLQPIYSGQRLQLSDHARRDPTRDRRAPADGPGGRAGASARRARSARIAEPALGFVTSAVAVEATRLGPGDRRVGSSLSDTDRILGLRLCRPLWTSQRDRGARQPDGLRGGRREHARDRVLGRRVRLLRTAAEPRRLRRDRDHRPPAVGAGPQGRHDGHLLRRDQSAVRRSARPAGPRGDLTAVDDRRDRDDAIPGRDPQHRVRRCVGRAAPGGGRAGRTGQRAAGSRTPISRSRAAIRPAPPTRCCTARLRA